MAAALKTEISKSVRRRRSTVLSASRKAAKQTQAVMSSANDAVVPLNRAHDSALSPIHPPKPLSLRILEILHQVSSLGMVIGVGLSMVGYAYSVHINRQFERSEGRLAQLQRNEQQLTTINEVLKNHLAEQVTQNNTGLKPPQLGHVIFLEPSASQKQKHSPENAARSASHVQRQPLGY